MTTQFRRNSSNDLIARINEGMVVYDSHNQRVGVVEFIKLNEEDSSAQAADMYPYQSFVNGLNGIFDDADDIPDELRARLAREGYLRIDGGFLAADRIALLDQIADVDENAVTLAVRLNELIIL